MGGQHAHQPAPETRRMRGAALLVLVPVALLTLAALLWLWPGDGLPDGPATPSAAEDATAEVVAVEPVTCEEEIDDEVNGCGTAEIRVTSGTDAGETATVALPNGPGAPEIAAGDSVLVVLTETPDGETYAITDQQRGTELWVVLAAFALAVVAFGRWRGITALAGLAFTFVMLLFFVVPAILDGREPVVVAIVGSAAIMLVVLYLTHGFTLSTTVAVLGTLISLTLTGLLSAAAVTTLHLTGVTDDVATFLSSSYGVDMQGLLLAGIVIGSLGVLDDVTVTQVSAVWELKRARPDADSLDLYRRAVRIGRDHISSTVNTLFLAYAGASLPLLLLFQEAGQSVSSTATREVVAVEIVRALVGSIGLVASVPISTALAATIVAGPISAARAPAPNDDPLLDD